jgi:hypothetical protein
MKLKGKGIKELKKLEEELRIAIQNATETIGREQMRLPQTETRLLPDEA